MISIEPETPAPLWRSRVDWPEDVFHADSEQIGHGSFEKMVRLALTDPDDEVWRYSAAVAWIVIEGDALRDYAV